MKHLKSFNKTFFKNISFIMLLVILVIFFYSNRIFLTGINLPEDTREADIPNASFFVKAVKESHVMPLWNPYKICGLPFFEVSFMGPYYPFVFLYFILPIEKAINSGFIIHILLTGIFMFVLSRGLKFSELVSFFCAFSWMLSSVFQQYSESGWLPETISATYFPLLIFFLIRVKDSSGKQRLTLSLLTSLMLALTITGGHYCYVIIILYSLLVFSLPFMRDRKYALFLSCILLISALLSIITWGPLLIQVMKIERLQKLTTESYNLKELANFLLPTNIRRGFAGRLVFLLAIIGLFIKKTPFRINLILLSIFSFVLMLGREIKLGNKELVDLIPFVNQVHYTWTWHVSFIFSLIILAGFALEKLSLQLANKRTMISLVLSICIALQLFDLYYFNKKFYPKNFQFTFKEFFCNSPFINFLRTDLSLFRVCNRFYDHSLFRANQGMLYNINSFESRSRGISLYKVNGKNELTHKFRECPTEELMDICNIKYIITWQDNLDSLRFSEILQAEEAYLYRNNFSYPRAFLLENTEQSTIEKLLFNGHERALLDINLQRETKVIISNYKNVDIKYEPNIYKISLECNSFSFLFLSEMFDSGWKAKVNGVPVKILSPFNFFMGMFLLPGKYSIMFKFDPLYFRIFYLTSTITVIIVILALLYLNRNYFRINNESNIYQNENL